MYKIGNLRVFFRPFLWVFLTIVSFLAASPAELQAVEMRAARRITIPLGEVISGNLYAAASELSVAGRVDGDLVAAGGNISLMGVVSRDAIIAGGRINVSGQIGGDLRAAGGQILLSGKVNGDLVVAAGTVHVLPGALVGGDVVLAGGDVLLDGVLVRSVKAVAGQMVLSGTVSGPVGVRTGKLVIGEHADLENELAYFSPEEASVHPQAKVKGPVTFHMISGMDQDWLRFILRRLGVAFFFLRFAMTLVAGLLGYFLLRKPSQDLVSHALSHFGREFLLGFVLFFVIPPAIFLILLTVVGAPVAFLGGLVHLSVGMVAVIYSGIALGTLLLKLLRRKAEYEVSWAAILVGIPIAFLVRLVPYFGFLFNATFFLVIFGTLYQRVWSIVRGGTQS